MVMDQGRPGAGVLDPDRAARAADETLPAPYRPGSLYEAVVALYARYVAAAARDLKAWPGFFTEDCRYQIFSAENVTGKTRNLSQPLLVCVGRGMVMDRANAYLTAQVLRDQRLRYTVTDIVILDADDHEITTWANFTAYRALTGELSEPIFTGEYTDRIVRRDGGLAFREKIATFDSTIVATTLAAPL